MSVKLPNGSIISIASGYEAVKSMSAVSNADPGVATLEASHGVSDGDILEVTSGWSKLDGKIVRAANLSTNDIDLEGVNTSNLTKFPAGSGVGSVREVNAWTQVTQVVDFSSQGGDQNFFNYSFLEDDTERQIPTTKSAKAFTLLLGDDQSLPWFNILTAADEDRQPRAIRVVLPSGAVLYYNVYVTFDPTPTMTKNEIMQLRSTFSLVSNPTRYAS
jgi:hypothetical protein